MEVIEIRSTKDLCLQFSRFREGYLFRGQTSHYADSSGDVSIPTSFSRHGCIPPLMFKWSHYSKEILRAYGGLDYHAVSMELSQAILQHYGWRSFYVDLTKSPHVACWFAANTYKENNVIEMCENIEEEPVHLVHKEAHYIVHKEAHYIESEDQGNIYVIDCNALISDGIKIHDLTDIDTDEGSVRFHVQEACLVGNFKDRLPVKVIKAHLKVDHSVLVDYYNSEGINETKDLFPDQHKDFILATLLSLPWLYSAEIVSIPVYRRGLELPDYHRRFTKHLGPSVTLYKEFWISDNRDEDDNPLKEIRFYKLPEDTYYANTNEEFGLAEVNAILESYDQFAIEINGLIRIPELINSSEFEKGIIVEKVENDVVSVSGLIIEHPGHVVAGLAVNMGWYYRIENDKWIRVDHKDECPCNNNIRHELQFALLRVLNEMLKDNKIV